MKKATLVAFVAGAATVPGFAPFGFFPLPVLTLAVLFRLWGRAATSREAALLGLAWGLGCFLVGVSWVYVSLHDVGGMVMPLAVAATFLFCFILSLFPALAGWLFARCRRVTTAEFHGVLTAAGLWTLAEWLRGWVLTGFPWLAIGYSQTPPSPLAGYAPVVGVYGVSLLVALLAALAAFAWRRPTVWIAAAILLAGGLALRSVEWTEPVGEPLTVSLLQGNVPQSLKWQPENLSLSIDTYTRLAKEHPAQLMVLPETAIPLLFERIPGEVLGRLSAHGDLLLGAAVREGRGVVNGAVLLGRNAPPQVYSKVHLVPFGEFVPPGFAWFFGLVNIPMSDFRPGPADQKPFAVGSQRLMPNICYEDLFGEEIRRALPGATLLVNLSNTAWFGDSLAQPQHLQIARMRALETGRPMLRATNTGMTALVAADGSVTAVLPPFTTGALTVSVRGHAGETPFVRFGNAIAVLLVLLACLPAAIGGQRWRGASR